MNQSEIQKEVVRRRWREEEAAFPLPDIDDDRLTYPHRYECSLFPGYYYIPWVSSRVVINDRGDLIQLSTGKTHPTRLDRKGYVLTSLRVGERYQSLRVHRLVGALFCSVPEKHQDKTVDELEINHKDGNKENNHYANLEWVTTLENMTHAWSSGLIKTELPVLARNEETGEIIRYRSISDCSRAHGISVSPLCVHLNSDFYGMIEADGHRYKFDNDQPWPEQSAVRRADMRIGMNCDCVGENVETGQKIVFASLTQASKHLNLPLTPLRLSRTRKGPKVPFMGWVFYTLSGLPLSKKLKGDQNHTLCT